jgi:alkyl sulfatase BDS1-like metallo-beta-lactamase superfamily hydrolase
MLSIKAAFEPADAAESSGVYELRIDADTYFIEVTDTSLHISRGTAPTTCDATLTTDLDTLRTICDQQTTMAAALDSGSLHLDGAEHAKQRLTGLLLAPFVPSPRLTDLP